MNSKSASQATRSSYAELIKGVQDTLTALEKFLNYEQLNKYSVIEIYHASTATYELCVHPELYLDLENNTVVDEEIKWWSDQTPPYNYSISGVIFYAWKFGKIKEIDDSKKNEKLCIKFDSATNDAQATQENWLASVFRTLEIDARKCVTHIPTLDSKKNRDFVAIEIRKFYKNSLRNGNIFMPFPLVIDQYWFLGYIFLVIYVRDFSEFDAAKIYSFINDSFLTQLVSIPLRKEIRDLALETAQQKIQKGVHTTEDVLREALERYLPFPVGRREAHSEDYLEDTNEFLIKSDVFPDFQESTWIPKAHNNEKVRVSLQSEIESLFKEIKRIIDELNEKIQSEKVKSDNYRERAIAHTQKTLYRAVAANLGACDLDNPHSEDFKIHFLNAQLLSTYIHFTNEMRQQGAYQISTEALALKPRSVKMDYFVEKLYVLVCILLDTSYGRTNELQEDCVRELANYVKKFVGFALKGDIQSPFPDFHDKMKSQYLDRRLSNLEFRASSRSLNISLPHKRAFFFTLLNSFFEIFANSRSHALEERVIINFDEHLSRLIISTKDECLGELLSPSKFYDKTKKDSKLTLAVLEQQFKPFGCSYEVSYLDSDDKIFSHVITDREGKLFTTHSLD